jgi:peptidyl-prolyl cis-trans isomerase SurA
MLKYILLIVLGASHAFAQDKLLDKIVAVINGKVFTLSELKRIEKTIEARKEISPFLYTPGKTFSETELLNLMIKSYVVRDKLSQQGYVVGDDSVESRIRMTEEKLGLNRDSLLEFLKAKGVSYEEYFEVIREAMEFNLFTTRIIAPLVTVTEQEIKNEFYKRSSDNRALSFKYNVVDFSVPGTQAKGKDIKTFKQALKDYQVSGRLSLGYSDLESSAFDEIKEDALAPAIVKALGQTPEGEFTEPFMLGDRLHSFYVKNKDLVESQAYLKSRAKLEDEIYNEKTGALSSNWFERELSNYFIKNYL